MNTTNKNMNTNEDDKNKIIISDANIITNGPTSQYHLIENINEIGTIMDKNNTKVSEITPLIMVLNQNKINCQDKVNEMINNDKQIHIFLYLNLNLNIFILIIH